MAAPGDAGPTVSASASGDGPRAARRLFVPRARLEAAAAGALLPLSPAEAHYLTVVLRLAAGAGLEVFDGEGGAHEAHLAAATGAAGAAPALTLGPRRDRPRPRAPLQLLFALARGDRCDLVVQKATELGVARLTPFAAERSVVRLDESRGAGRLRRWERIAAEAARQCGRADVPALDAPASLPQALEALAPGGKLCVLYEGGGEPLAALLDPAAGSHALAVGPEGGFTEEEVARLVAAGGRLATLGPRVLRFETAAIVATALAQHLLGELG